MAKGIIDVHTQDGKKEVGLLLNEVLSVEGDSLIAETYGVMLTPTSRRKIEGWYAVAVPGYLITPFDGDYLRIYASRNKNDIVVLAKKIEEAKTAISQVQGWMNRDERKCQEFPELDVNECCACSNGEH